MKKEKIPLTPDNCSCKVSELCEHCAFLTSYCKGMKKQPKGNWVNGENLDAIMFPCFCSYSNKNEKGIGFLSVDNGYYYIANINFQKKTQEDVKNSHANLKDFVIKNNIHILKGKIILFENKEGD